MEGKIYAAICAVMADIGAISKANYNQMQKYKFRGVDDVYNALHPAMIKNHVFVAPEILEERREERQTQKGGLLIYSVVKVRYRFYTDDGTFVEATVIGEAMDSGDKSMNKAMSAAFKYACFQTFCIPTEEMQDPDKDSPDPAPKQDEAASAYPPREELLAKIAEKFPAGSKNEVAILAANNLKSLDDATDAQLQSLYNYTMKAKSKKK